jgi:tetratricopeptide (TPR) repeat protein
MLRLRARVLATVGLLSVFGARPGGLTEQTSQRRVPGFEETFEWARIASTHEMGRVDSALRAIAAWPSYRLERVAHDLRLIDRVIRAAVRGEIGATAPPVRRQDVFIRELTLSIYQLEPLLGLREGILRAKEGPREVSRPDSDGRRAIATLMAKAAMLHADLMMAPPEQLRAAGVEFAASTSRATRVVDGQRFEVPSPAVHWAIARTAIDLLAPVPRGSPTAGAWYHATSAFLLAGRDYDAGRPHLEHGAIEYQDDGRIAFLLGAAYENLAAPAVQVLTDGERAVMRLEARDELLKLAEVSLRTAIEIDPALAEAGLRLARVCQLTGRHAEAVTLLERVQPDLTRAELAYYASLFLGRSLEALGRDERAGAAFARAQELFPHAQSPRLALAQLAWRSAQPADATAHIGRLPGLAPESGDGPATDPWWFYDASPALDALERIAAMRRAVEEFLR